MITNILNITDINEFVKEMEERFLSRINTQSFFRLSATPDFTRQININVQGDEILGLLKNPPYERENGWTVDVVEKDNFKPTLEGIENSDDKWRHLLLLKNGHLEFWVSVDYFYCWRQNDEEMKIHPRLYPYAVIEYPVSYLRLLKKLVETAKIETKILISGGYYNCKGCYLKPGHPESIIFQDNRLYKPKYWEFDKPIELRNRWIDSNFDPDIEAYEIVVEIYSAFGIARKFIPFFDENKKFKLT